MTRKSLGEREQEILRSGADLVGGLVKLRTQT
jgi:hypothetical protein